MERHSQCRCFHTGALHGTIKQLTSTRALWHVRKCWAGPVSFEMTGGNDLLEDCGGRYTFDDHLNKTKNKRASILNNPLIKIEILYQGGNVWAGGRSLPSELSAAEAFRKPGESIKSEAAHKGRRSSWMFGLNTRLSLRRLGFVFNRDPLLDVTYY